MIAQLATDVDESLAPKLITSEDWAAQEKCDGKRVEIKTDPDGRYRLYGRNGQVTTLPARFRVPPLAPNSWVDTEFIWGRGLIGLDLLAWNGEDLSQRAMLDRYMRLTEIAPSISSSAGQFQVVRCALDLETKAQLIKSLRDERAEGVILKLKGAPYTPGRPTSGGSLRRIKWRKSLDCIVLRRPNDDKESFSMFCMNALTPQFIGDVTARTLNPMTGKPFYQALAPGQRAVAEVSYLMASDTLRLIQPLLVRLRMDKLPGECTISQVQIGKRYLQAAWSG